MAEDLRIPLFFKYSEVVCGEDNLSPGLSDVYYQVIHNDPAHMKDLESLLDQYQVILNQKPASLTNAIKNQILTNPAWVLITQLIVKIWYLGLIYSLTKDPNNHVPLKGGGYYFHHEALIWKVASAHPAGLSGGYYGYWSYKPEN